MKKIIVLITVALFYVAGFASSPASWISSKEGRMNVEKIRIGVKNARVVLETGEHAVIPIENLDSYSLQGRIYEKEIVYKNGESTGRSSYMELLASRNGLNLYRNLEYDNEAIEPLNPVDRFYVYKGGKLYLALDEKSLPSVFNFYGLKWTYR
jgi:hypothetical protein